MLVIGPGYGHNAEGKSTSLNDNDCFIPSSQFKFVLCQ